MVASGSGLGARGTSSICCSAEGQTVGDLRILNKILMKIEHSISKKEEKD